jgi:hypothetical protein
MRYCCAVGDNIVQIPNYCNKKIKKSRRTVISSKQAQFAKFNKSAEKQESCQIDLHYNNGDNAFNLCFRYDKARMSGL